jgi:hypothetical protein
MVIVAAADCLCILWIGWSGTVEDLGVPVVFPACPSPIKTLIPDLKHHLIKYYKVQQIHPLLRVYKHHSNNT